jgi:hypothetical protein
LKPVMRGVEGREGRGEMKGREKREKKQEVVG